MKEKIKELRAIIDNVDALIWLLEGASSKLTFRHGGTVKAEIDCYSAEAADLQRIIDSILAEHGDEMLPTRD